MRNITSLYPINIGVRPSHELVSPFCPGYSLVGLTSKTVKAHMKGIGAKYYTVHTPATNHTYIPENYIYL